jgi:peptidyl-prolyl cis-trans isomerase B (cyclophilin B)
VVAATAAEALGELGQPGDAALEAALAAARERRTGFEESDVRLAALGALARLGGPKSLPALRRALAAPDPRERAAARAALDSLAARGVPIDKKLRQAAKNSETVEGTMPVGSAPEVFPLAEPPPARRARIVTPRGAIELELLPEVAPMAVESFVRLALGGFYARAIFHRVVPNFVIQGGCPRGDGWGGPGYALRGEISPESYGVGTVGMADAGLDTAGSQFFITHSPQPHLDGRYTVFARVVAGMGVVDRIQQGDPFRVEIEDE